MHSTCDIFVGSMPQSASRMKLNVKDKILLKQLISATDLARNFQVSKICTVCLTVFRRPDVYCVCVPETFDKK